MPNKDSSSEAASPKSNSGAQLERKNPNCGKCRNHGIVIPLRGHKKDCEFRDCECSCCILTVRRRVVMAAQNAHLKQRKIEEKRVIDGGRVTPPRSMGMGEISSVPSPPPSNPDVASQHFSRRVISDLEEHSYAANELIKMFGLEMNALPFVYAILGVAGDMRTAIEMVNEANKELMASPPKLNDGFNRSADLRHQKGVLSLVKPRDDVLTREASSDLMYTRNPTYSPSPN